MAAATLNVTTLVDSMKLNLNDLQNGITNAGAWLNDSQYTSILINRALSSETTYTLSKVTTGRYVYNIGRSSSIAVFLSNPVTPFAGDVDSTYDVYAYGLTVNKTVTSTGVQVDHAASTISITGAPVNFNGAMSDALIQMLTQQPNKDVSLGDVSYNVVQAAIKEKIAIWQGVKTSVT